MPPEQFAQAMAALGIGDETQVVAYDAAQVTAGRLWWCLQYYGHTNVRILNGGWNQWLQDKRPIAMGDAPTAARRRPRPGRSPRSRTGDVRHGRAHHGDPQTTPTPSSWTCAPTASGTER